MKVSDLFIKLLDAVQEMADARYTLDVSDETMRASCNTRYICACDDVYHAWMKWRMYGREIFV